MIINYYKQKGFFCFFVARVVTCQESVLTFWQHASGILAWPGARCHHVHGQRQRDCYTKKLYEAYFISDIHIKKQNKKQIPLYFPTEIKDLQPFAKVSSLWLWTLRQIFLPFLSVICRNISPGFLEDIQNSFLDVSAFCYGLCQDDPTLLQ